MTVSPTARRDSRGRAAGAGGGGGAVLGAGCDWTARVAVTTAVAGAGEVAIPARLAEFGVQVGRHSPARLQPSANTGAGHTRHAWSQNMPFGGLRASTHGVPSSGPSRERKEFYSRVTTSNSSLDHLSTEHTNPRPSSGKLKGVLRPGVHTAVRSGRSRWSWPASRCCAARRRRRSPSRSRGWRRAGWWWRGRRRWLVGRRCWRAGGRRPGRRRWWCCAIPTGWCPAGRRWNPTRACAPNPSNPTTLPKPLPTELHCPTCKNGRGTRGAHVPRQAK